MIGACPSRKDFYICEATLHNVVSGAKETGQRIAFKRVPPLWGLLKNYSR